MNANTLARQYDKLMPDERFRLVFDAIGRGDAAERARLDNTCPRKTYTMRDWEYLTRLRFVTTHSLLVGLRWRGLTGAVFACMVYACGDGKLWGKLSDEKACAVFGSLHALIEGVERFCAEIGIEAKTFWKIAGVSDSSEDEDEIDMLELHRSLCRLILDKRPEADKADAEACAYVTCQTLLTRWRQHTNREAVTEADRERADRLGLAPPSTKIRPEDLPPELAPAPARAKARRRKAGKPSCAPTLSKDGRTPAPASDPA